MKNTTSASGIDTLLTSVTEAEFLGFAKEYFRPHPGMRKALQDRLSKAEKDTAAGFDCKKEVTSIEAKINSIIC